MLQQFPSDEPLRAQRMTADEAHSVIALWQQEQTDQTGLTDRPAVPDVAEGLNISVEDVQRLLQTVRERRLEEQSALALEQQLSEIRLAEEERKLAEVQRQRAELQRKMADRQPRPTEPAGFEPSQPEKFATREQSQRKAYANITKAPKAEAAKKSLTLAWPLILLFTSVLVVVWLIIVIARMPH